MLQEHPLIQTPEEVEALAKRLRRERAIAVDTEADSFFHYFDKLCLLQIACRDGTGDETALVDPLSLPEGGLAPLAPLLGDPGVRKVFHAAEYDLYVLQRYGGVQVKNIFDTMISAQLLGYRSVGLAALVEQHFGVTLSKDQQRTDWSRRPLRPAQLHYAASDVRYLLELSELLEKELDAKQRLGWAQAEFAALEVRAWPERDFDKQGYLRIKGARELGPRQLAVLRELYWVRDQRARSIDRPPFKVLGNGTLLDLAQKPPRSKRALGSRKGITELVLKRFGGDILGAVERAFQGPEHPPEAERKRPANGRRRLDRDAEARLERLKRWRARRAEELELDPGVFCPNATLEEIAWARPRSVETLRQLAQVKGWWLEQFGAEVVEQLGS